MDEWMSHDENEADDDRHSGFPVFTRSSFLSHSGSQGDKGTVSVFYYLLTIGILFILLFFS